MAECVRPRILLVDDDPNVLEGLGRNLRPAYDVTCVTGAAEALQLVASQKPFVVVVSDLRMPGMDGLALLAALRRIAPGTMRVLLTGHGDVNAAVAAVNDGNVFRFLEKPCPQWALLMALQEAVEQAKAAPDHA